MDSVCHQPTKSLYVSSTQAMFPDTQCAGFKLDLDVICASVRHLHIVHASSAHPPDLQDAVSIR